MLEPLRSALTRLPLVATLSRFAGEGQSSFPALALEEGEGSEQRERVRADLDGSRIVDPEKLFRHLRSRRGMSLIEVVMSLSIMGIVLLGLVSASIVASGSTQISRRRSIMVEFAQSRMEQIISMTRVNIPAGEASIQSCRPGVMTTSCTQIIGPATGSFVPLASPGTGGWMLDVINGPPPPGVPPGAGPNQGDDLMFGPLLVDGDWSGVARGTSVTDTSGTLYARTTLYNAWVGGDTSGCANSIVANNTNVFCSEVHVEAYDADAGASTVVNMLHIWVRVVQGGFGSSTTAWQNSYVMLEEDVTQ